MRLLCSAWLTVFHKCFVIETTRKSYTMEDLFKIIQNHIRPPSIPVMKGLTILETMSVIVAFSMPVVRLPMRRYRYICARTHGRSCRVTNALLCDLAGTRNPKTSIFTATYGLDYMLLAAYLFRFLVNSLRKVCCVGTLVPTFAMLGGARTTTSY